MGTRNVITVLGAVAGYAIAGPAGARWGLLAGSLVGSAVDPVQIEGARLEDLKATAFEYGTPVPHCYGTPRVPGIVAWASEKQETATTSGGKGGPEATEYSYKQDVLFMLTSNEIAGVRRIWSNGKLIWSAADDASTNTLAASQETEAWESIEIFTGEASQLPWSVYEAAVGAGNAPAMRGRGCVGITGLSLGNSGYMPQLTFEIVTNGLQGSAPTTVDQLWAYNTLMPGTSPQVRVGSVGWTSGERVVPVYQPARYELRNDGDNLTRSVWGSEEEAREAGRALLSTTQVSPPSTRSGAWALLSRVVTPAAPGGLTYIRFDYTANFVCNDPMICGTSTFVKNEFFFVRYPEPDTASFVDEGVTYSVENAELIVDAPVEGTFFGGVAFGSSDESCVIVTAGRDETDSIGYLRGRFTSSPFPIGVRWDSPVFGDLSSLWTYTAFGDDVWFMIYEFGDRVVRRFLKTGGAQQAVSVDLGDYPSSLATDGNTLWVHLRAGGIVQLDAQTLVSAGSDISLSPLGLPEIGFTPTIHTDSDGHLQLFGIGNVYRRNFDTNAWDLVIAFGSAAATGIPYQDFFHIPVYTDEGFYIQCDTIDGDTAVMTAYGTQDPITVTVDDLSLADVVLDLCTRSGLEGSYVNVEDLENDNVRALAVTQVSSARQVIEMLMGSYFFEAVETDVLRFVMRGAPIAATIPFSSTGAGVDSALEEPFLITRRGDIEIPAQVAVTYINFIADYQSATEYSDRLIGRATGVSAVQLPIGLTPQEAKRIAEATLLDGALAATSIGPIALDRSFSDLEPTDVIAVVDEDGSTFRTRIVKIDDADGVRSLSLTLDDATALNSLALTDESYSGSTVVQRTLDTLLVLGDWPIFRDADNEAGHYAAASPVDGEGAWPGASLFRGVADAGYTEQLRFTDRAVIGTTTTVLGDWTGGPVFDEVNSVTVEVNSTLENYTRDAILNGTAPIYMIGAEAIYARTATLVSTGIYILTGLLRGRRGTDWATDSHAVGERFVRVSTSGVRRASMESGELGVLFSFKAPTFGRSLAAAVEVPFTNLGVGLKPFAPVDIRAARDLTTNDLTFTWKRRTRLSCRFTGALGINVPFGEASESYDVEIRSTGDPQIIYRTSTVTSASFTYTGAQQTSDGALPTDVLEFIVSQRSAVVGAGYVGRGETVALPPGGAHRYWRFVSIGVPGTFLEISELQLFEGAVRATGETVTSATAPVFGTLAELHDDDLATRPYWTSAAAEDAGFWIKYDFGSDKEITGFKQGGFDDSGRYIASCTLQYSDNDSVWTTLGSVTGLTYPGNNTLGSLVTI